MFGMWKGSGQGVFPVMARSADSDCVASRPVPRSLGIKQAPSLINIPMMCVFGEKVEECVG